MVALLVFWLFWSSLCGGNESGEIRGSVKEVILLRRVLKDYYSEFSWPTRREEEWKTS